MVDFKLIKSFPKQNITNILILLIANIKNLVTHIKEYENSNFFNNKI